MPSRIPALSEAYCFGPGKGLFLRLGSVSPGSNHG